MELVQIFCFGMMVNILDFVWKGRVVSGSLLSYFYKREIQRCIGYGGVEFLFKNTLFIIKQWKLVLYVWGGWGCRGCLDGVIFVYFF